MSTSIKPKTQRNNGKGPIKNNFIVFRDTPEDQFRKRLVRAKAKTGVTKTGILHAALRKELAYLGV